MDLYEHQLESCDGQLPPGFRFHPTDEELITYYLLKKVLDGTFTSRAIAEIDLNKSEPWELPGKAKMGEKEWYFFSLRDRKYPTGLRTNRATDAGYWKATGKDREIYSSRSCALVGMKKTLVFYRGRAPKGEKSNWVMHEYRLEGKFNYHFLSSSSKDEWVVTRVFQKIGVGSKKARVGLGGTTAAAAPPAYADAGSPSASTVPTAAAHLEREGCSYEANNERDHVPCFSTVSFPSSAFTQLQQHPLAASTAPAAALRAGSAPSVFPGRALQQNLQLPCFLPAGLVTASASAISSVVEMQRYAGAGGESWPPFDMDRKVDVNQIQLPVGAMVLDCFQSLLPSEQY